MFWMSLLLAALAAVFFKLGALSILNAVLSGGLIVSVLLLTCFAAVLLWRRFLTSKG